MNEDTYRDKLNDLQLEVEELRAKLKEAQTGDLVSRQAAIDEIDEWIKAFLENGHKESAADACLIQDGIIQLPSAQPKRCEDCVNFNKTRLLIPQPDHIRCRDCKYAEFKPGATIHCKELGADLYQWDYCSYAERNDNE